MNACQSKDFLDSFFTRPVDEHYEVLKENLSPRKKLSQREGKIVKKMLNECNSDSTSAEEDTSFFTGTEIKDRRVSVFNVNCFERTTKRTLKLKDALNNNWRDCVNILKKAQLVKILRLKAMPSKMSFKENMRSKGNSNFSLNN